MDMSPPDPSPDDEVVEADFVPGGWAAWDVTSRGHGVDARGRRSPRGAAAGRSGARGDDTAAPLRQAVAEMLVQWRTDRGMRQSEAAARLGIAQSWVSRIERGRAVLTIEMLTRLVSETGSDLSLRLVPRARGHPVCRIAREGGGQTAVQIVITGPEQRRSGPPSGR